MSTSQETGQPSVAAGNAESIPQLETSTAHDARHYCCQMLQAFRALRNKGALCDFTLITDGQKFKVHKVAMAACSDYFRNLLTRNMSESGQQYVNYQNAVSAGGLKAVVEFVYTGELALTMSNAVKVLSAANFLEVKVAVDLCCKYLLWGLAIDNCVDVFYQVEDHFLSGIFSHARKFILENFEQVANSEQYFKLKSRQFASMLAENGLRVKSEYRLFELVMRWIDHDRYTRQPCVAELLSKLRFPLMTEKELVEKVSRVPEMTDIPECAALLTEAKDYHTNINKQPLLQSERTKVRSSFESLVLYYSQTGWSYTFYNSRVESLREGPTSMCGPAIVVVNNFMFVCGGKDCTVRKITSTAHCFRYDPRFDSWYELTSMTEARRHFVVVALDGNLYAVGGHKTGGSVFSPPVYHEELVLSSVECFNIASNKWELRESIPNACYSHAGAACLGKIYISGGETSSGVSNNLYCYTPEKDTWEDRAFMLNGRYKHVMVELGEKLYVIGGFSKDGRKLNTPIECYCPLVDQWTVYRSTCEILEVNASLLDGRVYIYGYKDISFSVFVQTFDPVKDEIKRLLKVSPKWIQTGEQPLTDYRRACCILTLPYNI